MRRVMNWNSYSLRPKPNRPQAGENRQLIQRHRYFVLTDSGHPAQVMKPWRRFHSFAAW
jgi:hypothetical protein